MNTNVDVTAVLRPGSMAQRAFGEVAVGNKVT